jgi:hypothetical protein
MQGFMQGLLPAADGGEADSPACLLPVRDGLQPVL